MTPDERLEALLAWATAGGIAFEPIEIRIDATGNRSAFARRRIAAGEELVGVPQSMLITDVSIATTAIGSAVRSFEVMLQDRHLAFAVWLVLEGRDAASAWKPYVDALPTSYPWMPSERTEGELAGLVGTRALRAIRAVNPDVADDHDLLGRMVEELATLPIAALMWGRHVACSRCFQIAADDGSIRCLPPIADMIDHDRDPNASWAYVDTSARFEVRAARDIAAGEEIRQSYGAHGNASLFSGFGFALPDNRADEVELLLAPRNYGVGLVYDRRFERVMSAAAHAIGSNDTKAILAVIATAAADSLARIDTAPVVVGDAAWHASCAMVRDGERAVLRVIGDSARAADSFETFGALLDLARAA